MKFLLLGLGKRGTGQVAEVEEVRRNSVVKAAADRHMTIAQFHLVLHESSSVLVSLGIGRNRRNGSEGSDSLHH